MSSFIDSGAGIILSSYMVHFSPSIEQRSNYEANDVGVVWCGVAIMNGQIVYVFTDAC